jgi:hypothetical protein
VKLKPRLVSPLQINQLRNDAAQRLAPGRAVGAELVPMQAGGFDQRGEAGLKPPKSLLAVADKTPGTGANGFAFRFRQAAPFTIGILKFVLDVHVIQAVANAGTKASCAGTVISWFFNIVAQASRKTDRWRMTSSMPSGVFLKLLSMMRCSK